MEFKLSLESTSCYISLESLKVLIIALFSFINPSYFFVFLSDAWRRRRRRRRNGLQMDDGDVNLADLKKDTYPDEVPDSLIPGTQGVELLEDEEDYDVHPKHARV